MKNSSLKVNTSKGFTIVELLIVIVVIGILAAIVIVAFNGVQSRANDTAVKSDLAAFGKKLELAKVDSTDDAYPFATSTSGISLMGLQASKGVYASGNNLLYCRGSGGSDYAIIARSKSLKAFYYMPASGGVKEHTGTWSTTHVDMCPQYLTSYTSVWGGTWAGL